MIDLNPHTFDTPANRRGCDENQAMHQPSSLRKRLSRWAILHAVGIVLMGAVRAEPPSQSSDVAASSPRQDTPAQPIKSEEACKAKDGRWRRTTPYSPMRPDPPNAYVCELPNPRSGLACRSSSECGSALCVPKAGDPKAGASKAGKGGTRVEGECSKYSSFGYGCQVSVEQGAVRQICSD